MIRVLLYDGRVVSIRGSDDKHVSALLILIKVAPEDELSASNGSGDKIVIKAGEIKHVLDASGKPLIRKSGTLTTVRGKEEDED